MIMILFMMELILGLGSLAFTASNKHWEGLLLLTLAFICVVVERMI